MVEIGWKHKIAVSNLQGKSKEGGSYEEVNYNHIDINPAVCLQ